MTDQRERHLRLADTQATTALGAALFDALASASTRSLLITLNGDLGAGKSTLARGLIQHGGHDGPVPSPTYTLVEPYVLGDLRVNHLDLYRLADADELEFIGWRDLADSVRLVEWAERAPEALGTVDLAVFLSMAPVGRHARVVARTESGLRILGQLDRAFGNQA